MNKESNIAYIDGQNLHLGTKAEWWQIDFTRFRVYLRDKYKVSEAYYFMWFFDETATKLYTKLEQAWFIVVMRDHTVNLVGKKKGNVDVDIVFEMMRSLIDNQSFDKIILVSGDGDYIKPVKYLIERWKFKKILFPNRKYSTLYKKIKAEYWINLSEKDIKKKVMYIPKKKTEKVKKQIKKQIKKNKPKKPQKNNKPNNKKTNKKKGRP